MNVNSLPVSRCVGSMTACAYALVERVEHFVFRSGARSHGEIDVERPADHGRRYSECGRVLQAEAT